MAAEAVSDSDRIRRDRNSQRRPRREYSHSAAPRAPMRRRQRRRAQRRPQATRSPSAPRPPNPPPRAPSPSGRFPVPPLLLRRVPHLATSSGSAEVDPRWRRQHRRSEDPRRGRRPRPQLWRRLSDRRHLRSPPLRVSISDREGRRRRLRPHSSSVRGRTRCRRQTARLPTLPSAVRADSSNSSNRRPSEPPRLGVGCREPRLVTPALRPPLQRPPGAPGVCSASGLAEPLRTLRRRVDTSRGRGGQGDR